MKTKNIDDLENGITLFIGFIVVIKVIYALVFFGV